MEKETTRTEVQTVLTEYYEFPTYPNAGSSKRTGRTFNVRPVWFNALEPGRIIVSGFGQGFNEQRWQVVSVCRVGEFGTFVGLELYPCNPRLLPRQPGYLKPRPSKGYFVEEEVEPWFGEGEPWVWVLEEPA